jgi:hypothetical protein
MNLNTIPIAASKLQRFHIGKRNAYHQAGHVASIYLGNSKKNLPALHFQIVCQSWSKEASVAGRFMRIPGKQLVKLEGGLLIPDLPHSYALSTRLLSQDAKQQCQRAFEADVINLIAGSLAEAKYVALSDGEIFNANLVYLGALKYYGGSQDMLKINDYMACMYPDCEVERRKKLADLFLEAFGFVNDALCWRSITQLAETLCSQPRPVYGCEELIAIIDSVYKPQHKMNNVLTDAQNNKLVRH